MKDNVKEMSAQLPKTEINISELPSRGVSYIEGARISIRPYTYGEVRKASSQSLTTKNSIEMAIAGMDINFPPGQLTFMDCLYLGIYRKILTMGGSKFTAPFVCKKCGVKTRNEFGLNDIVFNDLDDDVIALPVVVEFEGRELHFGLLTVADYLLVSAPESKKIFKTGAPDVIAAMAKTVKNMGMKEAYDFLYDLSNIKDFELLDEIDKLLSHGMKPLLATCDSKKDESGNDLESICGTENLIKLEGREVLLNPFRNSDKADRTRIRYGNAPKS